MTYYFECRECIYGTTAPNLAYAHRDMTGHPFTEYDEEDDLT